MEILNKYIILKLESMLAMLFAMFYFIGDNTQQTDNTTIKDKISILTGVSIVIFYSVKTFKTINEKGVIDILCEKVNKLEDRVKELEK